MSIETQAAVLAGLLALAVLLCLAMGWALFHTSRALWLLAYRVSAHNASHGRDFCCELERDLIGLAEDARRPMRTHSKGPR